MIQDNQGQNKWVPYFVCVYKKNIVMGWINALSWCKILLKIIKNCTLNCKQMYLDYQLTQINSIIKLRVCSISILAKNKVFLIIFKVHFGNMF